MTLRLAVVGAGIMGQKVATAAAGLGDAVVTAVVDPDAGRASALASEHGAAVFADLPALVAAGVADAAYVGVPHALHEEACTTALRAGLHVLVDKPLCNERAEADAILAARGSAILMVGFSYRFRAEWLAAHEALRAGRIGTPRLVVDTIVEAASRTPAWYWDAAAGGGVLQLQSHHCFDRLRWLLDDPFAAVSCATSPAQDGIAEDTAVISARTAGGVLAGIELGFARTYDGPSIATTVIQGTAGQLSIDSADRTITITTPGGTETTTAEGDDWMAHELRTFVDACATGVLDGPSGEDGALALDAALAARASARSGGAWVDV